MDALMNVLILAKTVDISSTGYLGKNLLLGMKGLAVTTRIITTSAVGIMVSLVTMVGFYITLDVSPQVAYARLFIDIGLGIGLVAIIIALYKEKPLPLDSLIYFINQLKQGKYDVRVKTDDLDSLTSLGVALNELAKVSDENYKRQESIKKSLREELLPKFKKEGLEHHSVHPELGPVIPIIKSNTVKLIEENDSVLKISIVPKNDSATVLSNTLVDSIPPEKPEVKDEIDKIKDLYERFISAQREHKIDEIEYIDFLHTIERSKNEIKNQYNCQNVSFDVVFDNDEVALQPRLIR